MYSELSPYSHVRITSQQYILLEWIRVEKNDLEALYNYIISLHTISVQAVSGENWKKQSKLLDTFEEEYAELVKIIQSGISGKLVHMRTRNNQTYMEATNQLRKLVALIFNHLREANINLLKDTFIPQEEISTM